MTAKVHKTRVFEYDHLGHDGAARFVAECSCGWATESADDEDTTKDDERRHRVESLDLKDLRKICESLARKEDLYGHRMPSLNAVREFLSDMTPTLLDLAHDLRHGIWHAIDDSELHGNGERTITKQAAEELERLVPDEEHP